MKHFLQISDLSPSELTHVLELSRKLKNDQKSKGNALLFKNMTLGMIFEKPSLRTRVSFETGMTQLGGHAIYLSPSDIQMGKRESVADTARTLSRYVDLILARVFVHSTVVELAKFSSVPVINGLSDLEHPCQILADLLSMIEHKRKLKGLSVAFIGDGENNVTHSLAIASGMLGIDFRVANPKGYSMNRTIVAEANKLARNSGGRVREFLNPREAVANTDVVYTDTWVSMGDEEEKEKRIRIFSKYQVTRELLKYAKSDAIFMHDMPAYRGNEVASDVIDGPQSIIFDQAENRLHAQKGIMAFLLGKESNN